MQTTTAWLDRYFGMVSLFDFVCERDFVTDAHE